MISTECNEQKYISIEQTRKRGKACISNAVESCMVSHLVTTQQQANTTHVSKRMLNFHF